MTRPAEDRTVLDAVRRGDQRSLEELYRRHSPRLYGLLLRMLRETADAEEILQETFVDAWRRAGEYAASRGSVEAWLITIARSRAIDRIRNRGARLRLVKQSEQLASADAPQPEPPDVHAQTRLRKALGTLPPEQRRALELAYWEGLSQSEISRETGDPLGTVKTRVRLGLQRLAELLAG
ncbi:MAG TPA: sigma-70 family RNA polymerase sigma factor [Myxococcaceae bacterium]|nr:sigma-70 family RNA polymerase sigma factor [Myxococcaceae bacterium]